MSKSIHFFGQPVYGQLINSLDKDKIIKKILLPAKTQNSIETLSAMPTNRRCG